MWHFAYRWLYIFDVNHHSDTLLKWFISNYLLLFFGLTKIRKWFIAAIYYFYKRGLTDHSFIGQFWQPVCHPSSIVSEIHSRRRKSKPNLFYWLTAGSRCTQNFYSFSAAVTKSSRSLQRNIWMWLLVETANGVWEKMMHSCVTTWSQWWRNACLEACKPNMRLAVYTTISICTTKGCNGVLFGNDFD